MKKIILCTALLILSSCSEKYVTEADYKAEVDKVQTLSWEIVRFKSYALTCERDLEACNKSKLEVKTETQSTVPVSTAPVASSEPSTITNQQAITPQTTNPQPVTTNSDEKDTRIASLTSELNTIKSKYKALLEKSEIINIWDFIQRNKWKEFKFSGCNKISAYSQESFYNDFTLNLSLKGINLTGQESACYSPEWKILVFIPDQADCSITSIYRYDITNSITNVSNFTWDQKDCYWKISLFWKREGSILKLTGQSTQSNCAHNMKYDYNFIENNLSLTEDLSKCPN